MIFVTSLHSLKKSLKSSKPLSGSKLYFYLKLINALKSTERYNAAKFEVSVKYMPFIFIKKKKTLEWKYGLTVQLF